MTEKSEALRLAEYLDLPHIGQHKSAAELRRLHAVNAELLEALKMGYADTMDYIQRNHLSGAENNRWLVLARAAIAKAEGEAK
jgi:hypothetical protein